jgi:hypothetical protein
MNANTIARKLVAEMTDAMQRHVHPRSGQLMPPRLTGRHGVAGLNVGEQVLDRADELLEAESATWLPGQDPDVSLELCKSDNGWEISWSIGEAVPDKTDAVDSDDDAVGEGS